MTNDVTTNRSELQSSAYCFWEHTQLFADTTQPHFPGLRKAFLTKKKAVSKTTVRQGHRNWTAGAKGGSNNTCGTTAGHSALELQVLRPVIAPNQPQRSEHPFPLWLSSLPAFPLQGGGGGGATAIPGSTHHQLRRWKMTWAVAQGLHSFSETRGRQGLWPDVVGRRPSEGRDNSFLSAGPEQRLKMTSKAVHFYLAPAQLAPSTRERLGNTRARDDTALYEEGWQPRGLSPE